MEELKNVALMVGLFLVALLVIWLLSQVAGSLQVLEDGRVIFEGCIPLTDCTR